MHVFYRPEGKRIYMIAIFDGSENKVVIIGDKLYRLSIDEFNKVRPRLDSIGLTIINSVPTTHDKKVNTISDNYSGEKKYIASSGSKSVIVNDLEPKLQFMGIGDIKSIDEITSIYKKIPEQVSKLINAGRLISITEDEKNKRIELASMKKVPKGARIKQSSSIEEKMSAGDYEGSYDDGEDSEDRIIRNAVKIDL